VLLLFTKIGIKENKVIKKEVTTLAYRQFQPIKVNIAPPVYKVIVPVATKGEEKSDTTKKNTQRKYKTTQQRILEICNSLNGKLEVTDNKGKEINEILSFNKLPTGLAYCGATVHYILTNAGVDYNVYKPYWASNNFIDKSKIVYEKGKWYIEPDSVKIGYVTGYKLNRYGSTDRINHVGLYMAHGKYNQELFSTTKDKFKVFEGNTSNPNNPKQQGLFYKDRPYNITLIRRYD
jgi:hypothetical protein